ncbi:MAG: hypothetical protein ABI442_21910, partial [Gemmatimonadaceae bacterium]
DLPRPKTGDGVFFDLPVIGLIVYPVWLSIPLAIVALLLVGALVWRVRSGVVAGAAVSLALILVSACAAWGAGKMFTRAGTWSGLNALGIVLLVLAIGAICRRAGIRWSSDRAFHAGGLAVLAVLGVVVSVLAPGVSYLFVWPVIFAATAALATHWRAVLEWLSAAIVLLILAGFAYATSVVMLGLSGAGAIALGVLVAIIVIVLIPHLALVNETPRWSNAGWMLAAACAVFVLAALTVHSDADHPIRSALAYEEHADSNDAWLGTFSGLGDDWTRGVLSAPVAAPAWASRTQEFGATFVGQRVGRVPLDAPNAVMARDTTINGFRRVVLRVTAPHGATTLLLRAPGARVATASIDGRIVDTTRYRYKSPEWVMLYHALPDSGAIVALSIPLGAKLNFEIASTRPGLPSIPGVAVPARPAYVAPSQDGDVSVVYRRFVF